MANIVLSDEQKDALNRIKNGCILCGGCGSGKSRTALAYYFFKKCGGGLELDGSYIPMTDPKDLYIITTARKRDTLEWEEEMAPFLLSTRKEACLYSENTFVVDSWNNIKKYMDVENAFFIFDEQRVVGSGTWVKSFLKITKSNSWILLSATPGDTWMDYIPVFVANGFYKNRSEFIREHVIYKPRVKWPQIDRYINTRRLVRLRDNILVDIEIERKTQAHHEDVYSIYDISAYKEMVKKRWNPWTNEPFLSASELCYSLRKLVNSDESRVVALLEIFEKHPKAIVFYNFDYELDILKSISYGEDVEIAEWNGHAHQPIPESDRWVYLVQYAAGAEGWNCIKTDTIIFFSQNYSYKVLVQACGRIDRMNTPYTDLYYYHLKSRAGIDLAIGRALKEKKSFNETRFVGKIINCNTERKAA